MFFNIKNTPEILRGVDNIPKFSYNNIKKGATDRRFPFRSYREVTVCREAWRLLLFIFCLDNQGDKCDNEHSKTK